jgi:hypothetical protein
MIGRIQDWIEICLRDHVKCITSTVRDTFVPKRLIQIGQHNCRLLSSTSPVRYAALSYCWGTIKQLSTTKATVDMRYDDLQCQQLPQTIQDAIAMTRMLDLRYLWIDSICIIQDDREEWAQQAADMADIYSSAYVVLAATGVSNATDGFLHQRSQPLRITSLANGSEHPITISARVVNNHDIFQRAENLDNQPLSKRGWALQERSLAIRTVHFLPDEIMFECRSGRACECGRLPEGFHYNNIACPPETDSLHSGLHPSDWTHFVQLFKSRCLIVEGFGPKHAK